MLSETGRRWLATLVGLALAGVFGWLTVRKVDWSVAVDAMKCADWTTFALIPLVFALSVAIRALRWRMLLPAEADKRTGLLYRVAGIGIAANAVLPGKLGEIVAAHALGRLGNISRMQAIGILVIGRLADFLILSTLVIVGALILPDVVPEFVRRPAQLVLAAAASMLVLTSVLPSNTRRAIVQFLVNRVMNQIGPGVGSLTDRFAKGLSSVTGLLQLLRLLACTLLLWLTLALALWIATCAFDLQLAIGAAPLLLGVAAIGSILPSAPGSVGTYHFFAVFSLSLFGVSQDAAVACIIPYHATDILTAVIIGGVCAALTGSPLWTFFTSTTDSAARYPEADTPSQPQGRS